VRGLSWQGLRNHAAYRSTEGRSGADRQCVDDKVTKPRMTVGHKDLRDLDHSSKQEEHDGHRKRPAAIAEAERNSGREEDSEMLEFVRHVGYRPQIRRHPGQQNDDDRQGPRYHPAGQRD